MALTIESIEKITEEYEKEIRKFKADMIEESFGIVVIWCPHCDEMIREGKICNSCNTVIESGLPACRICKSEKIYHDENEEYFCPFHEEEECQGT